ncbi:MAG: DUF3014 domain-containing protein [Desulfuromonadales bacterium]|nr:DUF3014 domain-containing protein [Desulfuromonadales bacterium]
MKNWPSWIGYIAIGAIIAIAYWMFYRPEPLPPGHIAVPPPVSGPQAEPAIQHPITTDPGELKAAEPAIDLEQPLPTLKQSDTPMAEILARLFADQKLDRFFILEHFIERFVAMVDNLSNPQLPTASRPVKQTPGRFLASGERGNLTIDLANYKRYTPLVKMLAALDTQQVIAVYKHFYPLFQEAYAKLGYPDAYFNDRLVEVIDHLLTTPPVLGPVYLVQPKALYLYADPALEELSAGRKILLRCGPENAAQIKAMLHKYRRALTADNG